MIRNDPVTYVRVRHLPDRDAQSFMIYDDVRPSNLQHRHHARLSRGQSNNDHHLDFWPTTYNLAHERQ